ncbi:hypothetical protein V316_02725, partial [Staphylococcus aureus F12917]
LFTCRYISTNINHTKEGYNNKIAHDNDDAIKTRFLFFIVITFFRMIDIC